MFETAELGRKTSKKEYKELEPHLRVGLLTVQYELRESSFPVLLVLAGTDQLGCADVANLLHEWMDPRYIEANFFEDQTQEELERPRFFRYWRRLPVRGRIGIYSREWTARAIRDRVLGEIGESELDQRIRHIQSFEEALVDDGALVLKFWLHLQKREIARRRRAADKNPRRAWRVAKSDRILEKRYEEIQGVAERVLRETSRGETLWNIVESSDRRYRDVTIARIILSELTKRLARS